MEYLDEQGQVIMILSHDGQYYLPEKDESGNVVRDIHGFAQASQAKVSMNAQLSGSTAGESSYKVSSGGVAEQRLVGCATLYANPDKNILAATKNLVAAIEVRNADNEEVFAPSFKLWVDGNEDNYGPEDNTVADVTKPASKIPDNVLDVNASGNEKWKVTASAGTNFNAQLKKNDDMSYKNWFDFSTGQAVTKNTREELVRLANLGENHGKSNPAEFVDENGAGLSEEKKAEYANYRYGRITCYGITLQLYGNTDNEPENNRAAKGIKGMSLPVGDITFDVNFASEVKSNVTGASIDEGQYTAILWDYNENVPANASYSDTYTDPDRGKVTTPSDGKGNGGRNIYWDGETRSPYAKGAAPSNYRAYHDGCYYGGNWKLTNGTSAEAADISGIANPSVVTGTGADTTYHFSVSDYDFDFDTQHFPTRDAGNSGNVTGYDTYARCFSAGCVQVLSVFPMVQKVSEAEIFLNTTVSNLKVTTRAGQTLEAQADDENKINHEVNTKDNSKRDQIVLYAPGNLTKGSSFNGLHNGIAPNTTTDGFLGTDYWTTSYDCSTFAGDDIWIIGYGMISAGSDYRMRSMNLLQLFDSQALSVRDNKEPSVYQNWDGQYDEKGEATFLYAADPDHQKGYDTNKEGVLDYMNTVREEDLVYYASLDELKQAGYTCVGVLMELRGCDILGGKYQYMRTPVKVNGDVKDLVGKTVATVNTFRVWSWDLGDVSWTEGVWDKTEGKNELTGLPKPTNSIEGDIYSGELANREAGSPPHYVKTEYEDGHQVTGTHAGGTLSGNSLLILSYKALVDIGVDKSGSSEGEGSITYNVGNGETVVDYRLRNIKTEISDLTGQTGRPLTKLTVKAVLDEANSTGKERISVSGNSYRIKGYAVDANGNVANEETDVSISSDSGNPTVLEFKGSDGKQYRIKVYAQLLGSQSVSFVIQDAPVGLQLPDITFQANFAATTSLENNDTIRASAYISGEGDNRAYDQAKGNTDNVTVGVVLLGGTNLTKSVDVRYIELDGSITYDVIYTNSGDDTIEKIYFYDLLPHNKDIRGSGFEGEVVLRKFDVSSGKGSSTSSAQVKVYYSTTDYEELYKTVSVFGGKNENGTISGMNEAAVDEMLVSGMNEKSEPLFTLLGETKDGSFAYADAFEDMSPGEITQLMSTVTGLYAVVKGLGKEQTVDMEITVETDGNEADSWYKNVANSWIAGSGTLPLTSNKVETVAVARSISGVVWHDVDADGIRDEGEPLLEGVTCTLFKKNDSGKYEPCTQDATVHAGGSSAGGGTAGGSSSADDAADAAGKIEPMVTGSDGAYSFDKLAAGEYLVAFSGNAVESYDKATRYQVSGGGNAKDDSDGVAVGLAEGIDADQYPYVIRYSLRDPAMKLYSIDEAFGGKIPGAAAAFANYKQNVEHEDLGLTNEGSLSIAKEVIGGVPEAQAEADEFEFEINLTMRDNPGGPSNPVNGTYRCVRGPSSAPATAVSGGVASALGVVMASHFADDEEVAEDLAGGVPASPGASSVTFEGGKATVSLRAGERITLHGLPEGASYEVREVAFPSYYTPPASSEKGTILKEGTEVTVVNAFTPDKVTVAPKVIKTLTAGSADYARSKANELTFTLTPDGSNDSAGYELAGGAAKAAVTVPAGTGVGPYEGSFGNIVFSKAGTYKFAVTEDNPPAGFSHDAAKWELVVDVAVDPSDASKLICTQAYFKDGNEVTAAASCVFEDSYEPDEPDPPDEPDTPDEPDPPDEPDGPDEPDAPDDPDDPDKPDAPDEPAPAPSVSGDSGEPDNPAAPSEPKRPVALSQTGDVMPWVAGALAAAAAAAAVAAALAVRARRRGLRGEEGRR